VALVAQVALVAHAFPLGAPQVMAPSAATVASVASAVSTSSALVERVAPAERAASVEAAEAASTCLLTPST
jgi:hypothetical protein